MAVATDIEDVMNVDGADDPRVIAFGDRTGVAERYASILTSKGIKWGLLGPGEASRIWERHILNSVTVSSLIPTDVSRETSVVDVGSGAGLPGIPLSIARPDLQVTLLEPLLRRADFLADTVGELQLSNVTVVRQRAEDHKHTYDYVVCRAVAPLERLVKWCIPLLNLHGTLLALKGESATHEISDARASLVKKHLVADVVSLDSATVVRVKSDTP